MAAKVIVGLVIIVASFVYIMKNHDKSMIENMQDKQKKRLAAKKAAEAAQQEAQSAQPAESAKDTEAAQPESGE